MSAIKPLQAVCSQPKCRRRQTVPADRIWYVDVRRGPGSHREAGWRCYACKAENTTPPTHLPRGMILQLPSRQQVVDRLEAEAARKAAPAPTNGPASVRETTSPPTVAPRPLPIAAPTAARPASIVMPSAPVWATGHRARDILIEALGRIARDGGDALALGTIDGRLEPIEISIAPDEGVSIADHAADVLEELDEQQADVLVLGGGSDGTRWQVVLHYAAGAACFV